MRNWCMIRCTKYGAAPRRRFFLDTGDKPEGRGVERLPLLQYAEGYNTLYFTRSLVYK